MGLIWEIWLSCSTQWRAAMGTPTGIDLNAVKIVFDAYGEELNERNLQIIRALEKASLDYFRKEAKHGK